VSQGQNASDVAGITTTEEELRGFIVAELMSGPDAETVGAEEDLIRRGIVDSLGVQQLVDFCQSRYGIRVEDADLVLENFRTVRRLGAFVDRKQAEGSGSGRLRLRSRRR
jgi:acyl carrier protein